MVQGLEACNQRLYIFPELSAQERQEAVDRFKARENHHLDELNNISVSRVSILYNMRMSISFPFKTDINELLILFLENAMDQEDLERLRAVANHIKDIADYQSHIIDNVLDEELWENFFGLLVSYQVTSS